MIQSAPSHIEEREDRTIIFFNRARLNHETTRDLVPDLTDVDLRGRDVGLELRALEFVRPFGLIYLFWVIHWLLNQQDARRVDVVLDGKNRNICNYLKRMDLPDAFESQPVAIYPIQNLRLEERDLAESLVELSVFRVDNDDEVEQKTSRIMNVILSQRPDLRASHDPLRYTIAELLSNIQVHSRTREAAITVQAYRGETQLQLALGDGGIGITEALHRHVEGDHSDSGYILKALEHGVSSRIGGGGTGLTELADTVEELQGRMVIRSGEGQVALSSTDREATGGCAPLPGTLVEVSLPIGAASG